MSVTLLRHSHRKQLFPVVLIQISRNNFVQHVLVILSLFLWIFPSELSLPQALRKLLVRISKWTQFLLNIVEQGSAHLHASVADTPCTVAMSHRHLSFPPNLTIITATILHFQGHVTWHLVWLGCCGIGRLHHSEELSKCLNFLGFRKLPII